MNSEDAKYKKEKECGQDACLSQIQPLIIYIYIGLSFIFYLQIYWYIDLYIFHEAKFSRSLRGDVHANFYDGWTDTQEENGRRETIQHKKGQTYLFSGLLKCHLKISYQANKIFGQSKYNH
jgi:hypothetical protein